MHIAVCIVIDSRLDQTQQGAVSMFLKSNIHEGITGIEIRIIDPPSPPSNPLSAEL